MDNNELSRDEKFLKEVDGYIESNLENEQFGVDSLAVLMSTSRVQLYRRIEQLTEKNVSQYIREYRLKRAMELLEKDVATVSEMHIVWASAARLISINVLILTLDILPDR